MADSTNHLYELTSKTAKPSDAVSCISGDTQWGIDGTILGVTGVIIQSEDFTNEPLVDRTQDQKGRMVSQLEYDEHVTLQLQVIGTLPASLSAGGVMTYTDSYLGTPKKYVINSVTLNGSFEDKKKYTINAERWSLFPPQPTTGGTGTNGQ